MRINICQCPLVRLVTLEVNRSLWRDPNFICHPTWHLCSLLQGTRVTYVTETFYLDLNLWEMLADECYHFNKTNILNGSPSYSSGNGDFRVTWTYPVFWSKPRIKPAILRLLLQEVTKCWHKGSPLGKLPKNRGVKKKVECCQSSSWEQLCVNILHLPKSH